MDERIDSQLKDFIAEDRESQLIAESLWNGLEFGDTLEVERVLQQVISLVTEGQACSGLPGAFVERVAIRHFNMRMNIEPVFGLYRTFREQAKRMSPDDVLPEVGTSFGTTVGQIASSLSARERVSFIASSIAFARKENSGEDNDVLVGDLIAIAQGLHLEGLNVESGEMCKFLIYLGGTSVSIDDSLMGQIKELHASATNPFETPSPIL